MPRQGGFAIACVARTAPESGVCETSCESSVCWRGFARRGSSTVALEGSKRPRGRVLGLGSGPVARVGRSPRSFMCGVARYEYDMSMSLRSSSFGLRSNLSDSSRRVCDTVHLQFIHCTARAVARSSGTQSSDYRRATYSTHLPPHARRRSTAQDQEDNQDRPSTQVPLYALAPRGYCISAHVR